MAWTSPRTWTAGEVITPRMLNDHVRDNLRALDERVSAVERSYHADHIDAPPEHIPFPSLLGPVGLAAGAAALAVEAARDPEPRSRRRFLSFGFGK